MNYLSLFSGIGGFEYGIIQSKYANQLKCIGFSEIDKYAKNIYKKHYPNHTDLGDVTKIRTENISHFDFMVGGFPCQAFSHAGKRRGFNDTRGTLFFEIARILKDKKPKYFLLENVKGLLSHDKGRTFKTILRTLTELGYNVQWSIYNSKNHGVPQNRERIFLKGFLRTRCGQEILSIKTTNEHPPKNTSKKNKTEHIKRIKLRNNTKKGYVEASVGDGIVLGQTNCRGRVQTQLSPTIHTECGVGVLMENYQIRKLTPIECERLQGFPDNYTQLGVNGELISDTQRYKCCGNAVTTTVVRDILNAWNMNLS